MQTAAAQVLEHLNAVQRERTARTLEPAWGGRVQAIKTYQQQRFVRTYGDLLASPRYAPAANFFLDELYGPRDFSERDAQFARIVPVLVRLFPREIVETVSTLAALHALSESLDSDMGRRLAPADGMLTRDRYAAAWRACGRAADRQRQVALTVEVGSRLDNHTRSALLLKSLRLMQAPAAAAGLGRLQKFLEAGFDAFAAMRGAGEFLATVRHREQTLVEALFDANTCVSPSAAEPLSWLP